MKINADELRISADPAEYRGIKHKRSDSANRTQKYKKLLKNLILMNREDADLYKIRDLKLKKAVYEIEIENEKKLSNVRVKEEIGFGGFAKVFRGEIIETKEEVALKAIKYLLPDEKSEIIKEVDFLRELKDCPSVIRFIASKDIEDEKIILLVLELMDIDFHEYRKKQKDKKMTFDDYYPYFLQLSFCLSYLQKRGIQHRDLKSKNFLVKISEKKIKLCDFGVAINFEKKEEDAYLAGTTRYMAPEIYKNIKENESLVRLGTEQGSEKIIKPYHLPRISTMEDLNNTQTLKTTLRCKLRNTTTKMTLSNKFNVTYNSNFLSDVFSFGVNVLESLGVGINELNRDEKHVADALNDLKKIEPGMPNNIFSLIKMMLAWNESERPDFIYIEDYLLYTTHCSPFYYLPSNIRKDIIKTKNIYVSKIAFEPLTLEDCKEKKSAYFFSIGWKCTEIPKEYQRFLEDICKNNGGESIEKIKILINKTLISEGHKQILQDFLNSKEKGLTDLKRLIKAYTLPSDLFTTVNNVLANNKIEKDELTRAFVSKFLEEMCRKGEFDLTAVKAEYVYRGIKAEKNSKNNIHRFEYLPNMEYFWPAFSSTSIKKETAKEFMDDCTDDCILFEIKLNLKNQRNKLDISSISTIDYEKEVLLLPYFRFRVISNSPEKLNNHNICLIKLEELGAEENLKFKEPTQKLFQFVWFDRNVLNSENELYFSILDTKYSNDINKFKDVKEAIDFTKNTKKLTYIITSGEGGDEFLKEVHNLPHVLKVAVFCYNTYKHKKWASKEKYPKLLDIFDDFFELNSQLINPFY